MPAVQLYSKHPLQTKKLPGPVKKGNPNAEVESTLERAVQVLDLVESGQLRTDTPEHFEPARKRLTKEDEKELSTRFQTWGDSASRNVLIKHNVGLVYLAMREFRILPDLADDAFIAGVEGLIRAVGLYNHSKNVRFSTYALYWIKAKIQRCLKKEADADMSPVFGVPSLNGKTLKTRHVRLNAPARSEFLEEEEVGDYIPSASANPYEETEDSDRKKAVRKAVEAVRAEFNNQDVCNLLDHRLFTDSPQPLREIGRLTGKSGEWMRQLELRVVRALRAHLIAHRKEHDNR